MSAGATTAAIDALASSMPVTDVDRDDVTQVITVVELLLLESGYSLSDDRRLALAAHSLAFSQRTRAHERLPEIDLEDFPEIPEETVSGLRNALIPFCASYDNELHDEEVLLFAMHFEVARMSL